MIINNMKKVSIVIYYYINFFLWPKSGGDFDRMSPPSFKSGGTCPPIPPLCDAPTFKLKLFRLIIFIFY